MKKIGFLLLLFLIFTKSYSQVEIRGVNKIATQGIQSDSINVSPNKDFEERIRIKPTKESKNDVEIRFYAHSTLTDTRDLLIIQLHESTWKGIIFRETNYPKIKISKYKLKAKAELAEVYTTLLENNLTRLPNQEELKPKMRKVSMQDGWEVEHKLSVTDGTVYMVEFKIGDKFRVYSFHSPELYSEFYPDVQELKDYVAIKKIFETKLIE
ncbi:hypothetical protein Q0590_01375 [Rhodocytophaga aerolata]|uniref:Uncharacterized protein n=1 Tax=Rhodocytophaga aerolata TaxID=455078 RepID=A0ABT8QYG2_9BACT|nr:hypothetical protein [Rhodocytophaga aerolata]MDO1444877.1 hypothetical protein [Rhodocytophaga aerolata]